MGDLLDAALAWDNLCQAWQSVAENSGAAGVDDVSIKRWVRGWEERLITLAQDVRANHYRPASLRRRRIPKRQAGEFRVLRIPTVTDRVLQRAVYQALLPACESDFMPCSYGYRPGRGLQDAIEQIVTYREAGLTWVLDADIDAFFDQVDQTLLLELLREQTVDEQLLALIAAWLAKSVTAPGKGLPMGSPLSPLLANLYLNPFDHRLVQGRWPLVRYADDFIILTSTEEQARRAYQAAGRGLERLQLRYEPSKTRVTSFRDGFAFLGVCFEGDHYTYTWEDKRVSVEGARADWLFGRYGPQYDS